MEGPEGQMTEDFSVESASDDAKAHDQVGPSSFFVGRKEFRNVHPEYDHDCSINEPHASFDNSLDQ